MQFVKPGDDSRDYRSWDETIRVAEFREIVGRKIEYLKRSSYIFGTRHFIFDSGPYTLGYTIILSLTFFQ